MQLQHIDNLWMLVCTALVMLIQIGFICLEDSQVRRKNSVNVAIKNMIDFAWLPVSFGCLVLVLGLCLLAVFRNGA